MARRRDDGRERRRSADTAAKRRAADNFWAFVWSTVRSRYKRIIYKRIWVASLPFQSVQATFIDMQLNQPSLITRTHCIYSGGSPKASVNAFGGICNRLHV